MLDEPSASLPADEVHRLFAALRPLKARGVGMIYVSHRLDEVFEIADRIAVLRDGTLVGERLVAETTPDELVSLIVGKALDRFEPSPSPSSRRTRLAVRGLTVEGAGPVDFAVAQSEIVGLVGLRGAGQERVGRALFGVLPHGGEVLLDGETPLLDGPRSAMRAGIGLIARDRLAESEATGLTIRENTFINPGAIGRGFASPLSPRAGGLSGPRDRRASRPSAERPTLAYRGAVGRQPAEGDRRALAPDRRARC